MTSERSTRFDDPLCGVLSDALHLVLIWPACGVGFLEKVEYKPPKGKLKRELFEKQGEICTWCESQMDFDDIEVDHVWPIAKGGRHFVLNLQVLHRCCNRKKSDRIGFAVENVTKGVAAAIMSSPVFRNRPVRVLTGVVLVMAGCYGILWLTERVDGEHRYVLITRNLRDSLANAAYRVRECATEPKRAAGHARQAWSSAKSLGRNAGDAAGQAWQAGADRASKVAGCVNQTAAGITDALHAASVDTVETAPECVKRAGGSARGAVAGAVDEAQAKASEVYESARSLFGNSFGSVAQRVPVVATRIRAV